MANDTHADIRPEAQAFFDSSIPRALRRAREYAGPDGFVASMPQLLHARLHAPFDNDIWNTWYTANSEEDVCTTPQGHRVVVAVHGGGILGAPDRWQQAYLAGPDGITGQLSIKCSDAEQRNLLAGRLPDGTEIPVYGLDEVKAGLPSLPARFAVVVDYALAKGAVNGYELKDRMMDDPMFIVRAGGAARAAAYIEKATGRHRTARLGSWHPFNRIDPAQPQARMLFLSGNAGGIGSDDGGGRMNYDEDYGLGGDAQVIGIGRYVAVTPRNARTSIRDLRFEP